MRKALIAILFAATLLLSGCYRQTTIILQQGQTLPPQTDSTDMTAKGTEPTTVPAETSAPAEMSPPVEATMPVESTAPIESTAPAETTVPMESTAPAKATAPAESTPQPASTASTEPEPTQHPVYDISNHSTNSFDRSILDELNRCREAEGLPPLSMNKKLAALASIRAYECSVHWGHTRLDGRSWSTVLSDYGYGASVMAENILYASSGTGAAALADAWMSSSNHKANVLGTAFSSAGVCVCYANGYVYVAVLFAG